MKINIVTVSSGWILQKIAERIKENNKNSNVSINVNHYSTPDADINYYVDLQNCYSGQKTKCDIAYFTHAHENSEKWAYDLLNSKNAFNNLKGIVSMNKRYTDMLIKIGFPKDRLITIVPGETNNTFPLKKIKIGIVSRGGYEGYGQFFIEKLFDNYQLNNFEFYFLGNGWESGIKPIAEKRNIFVKFVPDTDYSIYPAFYKHIDFLLIPGLWTAGPMSMQEALSTGVPVIASDVGFVNYEFMADYVYPPNDCDKLYNILQTIQNPILARRQQVENMSWEKYTKDLINFFEVVNK